MRQTKQFLAGLLTLLLVAVGAKADDVEKYKAFAEETRQAVWALDLPEFANATAPAKYKDESAVILAAHSRLEITKKTRFNAGAFFSGFHYIDREVNCRDIYRMLVQINDKAALKEFSEFDYKAETKKKNWRYDEKFRQVLGVRIIKPDGTVKEVDTDEYMTATEGKEQRQKLAVPGLEVGDKLDLFFFNFTALENHNLDPFVFSFYEKYPMLSYTVHCEIDGKLTAQYRTLNGAPEFQQTKDGDNNIILDAAMKDIDRTEPELWYNSLRQTPTILLYVTNSMMKKYTYISHSASEKGLQANPDAATMQDDDWRFLDYALRYNGTGGLGSPAKMSKMYRYMKKLRKKDWTDEQKADWVYNYYRFAIMTERNTSCGPEEFLICFARFLWWAGVKQNDLFGMTTADEREPLDKLSNYRATTWFVALPEGKKYYFAPTAYLLPHEIPTRFQGQQAILQADKDKAKKLKIKAEPEHITLPAGTADDNVNTTTMQVDLDNSFATIHRNEQRTGTLKEDFQRMLAKDEDIDAAYRRMLSIDKELAEQWGKKYADDIQEAFRKGREQEKEDYKEEINYYHGAYADELLDYKMQALGNRPDSAALVYDVTYQMNGYVRKAGPNYVLSAGKLIGEQTRVEGKDRTRTADVYMSAPRTFRWNISVDLPAGYQVAAEGLAKLNVNVQNSCGTFTAKAAVEGGKLVLNIEKRYNHKTEPAANWPQLLEIIDAAKAYEALSVVVKK